MASYGQRFVETVGEFLKKNKLVNGKGQITLGKINGKTLAELADKFENSERSKDKKERAKRLSKGERDLLFDALAKGTGGDAATMTDSELRRCAVAISAIIKATPDVATSDVEVACAKYRRDMPTATITPTAISGNWSKLFDTKRARPGGGLDLSEPKVDWRPALKRVAQATISENIRRTRLDAHEEGWKWYQFGAELKRLILEDMAREKEI